MSLFMFLKREYGHRPRCCGVACSHNFIYGKGGWGEMMAAVSSAFIC